MRIFHLFRICLIPPLLLSACQQQAEDAFQIENAWIREAPPGATAMAGYMRITNHSNKEVILQSANSPEFKAIEFHRSVDEDGVYKMIPQLHLHMAAQSSIELKPGDYHLMMFKPNRALKEGDTASINLVFSNNQIINTTVPVKKAQY